MALTTDRISVLRGRPPVRAGGRRGFRTAHCWLVRSLGYGFGFITFLRSRPPLLEQTLSALVRFRFVGDGNLILTVVGLESDRLQDGVWHRLATQLSLHGYPSTLNCFGIVPSIGSKRSRRGGNSETEADAEDVFHGASSCWSKLAAYAAGRHAAQSWRDDRSSSWGFSPIRESLTILGAALTCRF